MSDDSPQLGCECFWPHGPRRPSLIAQDVHLWISDYRAWDAEALAGTLSVEESGRAARFHRDEDRIRFIVAKGLLRQLLGRYLDREPAQIALEIGPFEKPRVAGTQSLFFNISHSGDLCLYAIAGDREVGVDIERIQRGSHVADLGGQVFTASEEAYFETIKPEQRVEAFFDLWTCKEACVKCMGIGMRLPLKQIEMTLLPGTSRAVARCGSERWSILRIRPASGYVAALAVTGDEARVSQWQL